MALPFPRLTQPHFGGAQTFGLRFGAAKTS